MGKKALVRCLKEEVIGRVMARIDRSFLEFVKQQFISHAQISHCGKLNLEYRIKSSELSEGENRNSYPDTLSITLPPLHLSIEIRVHTFGHISVAFRDGRGSEFASGASAVLAEVCNEF